MQHGPHIRLLDGSKGYFFSSLKHIIVCDCQSTAKIFRESVDNLGLLAQEIGVCLNEIFEIDLYIGVNSIGGFHGPNRNLGSLNDTISSKANIDYKWDFFCIYVISIADPYVIRIRTDRTLLIDGICQ